MERNMPVRERRIPPPGLGELVRTARMRHGWRLREAARIMQISASYLCRIETGERCPSTVVAHRLAEMLPMTESERTELFAAALPNVGRDHPSRHAA